MLSSLWCFDFFRPEWLSFGVVPGAGVSFSSSSRSRSSLNDSFLAVTVILRTGRGYLLDFSSSANGLDVALRGLLEEQLRRQQRKLSRRTRRAGQTCRPLLALHSRDSLRTFRARRSLRPGQPRRSVVPLLPRRSRWPLKSISAPPSVLSAPFLRSVRILTTSPFFPSGPWIPVLPFSPFSPISPFIPESPISPR